MAAEWHGWNLKTLHNHRFRCFFALFPGGKPPILLYHENRLLLTLMFSHHVFHSNAGRRLHGCPCSQTHAHIIHIIHIILYIYYIHIYIYITIYIYICYMSIMLIVCLMIISPIGLPLFIRWIPIDGEHIQFLDYQQFLSKTHIYIYITHIMYHVWRLSLCFHIYIYNVCLYGEFPIFRQTAISYFLDGNPVGSSCPTWNSRCEWASFRLYRAQQYSNAWLVDGKNIGDSILSNMMRIIQ